MNLAPIVLFVYNRPWHTEQTLNALMKNELADESVLYIYADGPKANESKEKHADIEAVRKLIKSKQWCKEVHIIESTKNKGLANSVIEGVTQIVNKFEKIIVLEDDIVTSKQFLVYMNRALYKYKENLQVGSVAAYLEPIKTKRKAPFFLSKGTSWGWGTWKRIWDNVIWDINKLIECIDNHENFNDFDFAGYPYHDLLLNQKYGKVDSWGIRFYAYCFSNNLLHLTPPYSLTANVGFDGTGQHCGKNKFYSINKINDHKVDFIDTEIISDKKIENLILKSRKKYIIKNKINYYLKKLCLKK